MTPTDVRLVPGPDAVYEWEFLPERQHLFQKQISKHNIAACKEIASEIGKSIHATPPGVPKPMLNKHGISGNSHSRTHRDLTSPRSFSSIISELTERTEIQSTQLMEDKQLIEERDEQLATLRLQYEDRGQEIAELNRRIAAARIKLGDFQNFISTFGEQVASIL